MRNGELINLRNHIKRDFSPDQRNDILKILDLIDYNREIEKKIDRLTRMLSLLEEKEDLKISVLAAALQTEFLKRGIDIEIPEDLFVKCESEETTDEGVCS